MARGIIDVTKWEDKIIKLVPEDRIGGSEDPHRRQIQALSNRTIFLKEVADTINSHATSIINDDINMPDNESITLKLNYIIEEIDKCINNIKTNVGIKFKEGKLIEYVQEIAKKLEFSYIPPTTIGDENDEDDDDEEPEDPTGPTEGDDDDEEPEDPTGPTEGDDDDEEPEDLKLPGAEIDDNWEVEVLEQSTTSITIADNATLKTDTGQEVGYCILPIEEELDENVPE